LTAKYPADDGATFSVAVTNIVSGTNSAVATLRVLTNLDILNQLSSAIAVTRSLALGLEALTTWRCTTMPSLTSD